MLYSKQEAIEKLSAILADCSDVRGFVDTTYGWDATLWGRVTVHEVMAKNVVNMLVKQQLIIDRLQAENDALKAAIAPKALYIELPQITEHDRNALKKAMEDVIHSESRFLVPSFSKGSCDLYECVNKGGIYEYVGLAYPAGIAHQQRRGNVSVYRDVETNAYFFRHPDDFEKRMRKIKEQPAT